MQNRLDSEDIYETAVILSQDMVTCVNELGAISQAVTCSLSCLTTNLLGTMIVPKFAVIIFVFTGIFSWPAAYEFWQWVRGRRPLYSVCTQLFCKTCHIKWVSWWHSWLLSASMSPREKQRLWQIHLKLNIRSTHEVWLIEWSLVRFNSKLPEVISVFMATLFDTVTCWW